MSQQKKALYSVIVDHLLESIRASELRPGDQIPTEQALSESFNVSRITTTRAVKELEQMGYVYRVQGKGTFVTEAPPRYAPGTQGQAVSTRMISLVLPFTRESGSGYQLLHSVERVCGALGHYFTLHNTEEGFERERETVSGLFDSGKIEGIVVYPLTSHSNLDVFSRLAVHKFPFVVLDRELEGIEAPFVGPDNAGGVKSAVEHLRALGHTRIAYIGDTIHRWTTERERYLGYCRGLIDSGVVLDPRLIHVFDEPDIGGPAQMVREVASTDAQSEAALRYFRSLDDPPTAVVAVNDILAVSLVKTALALGVDVPGEISIVGFDDLPISRHLEVPLTTVRQPFGEIGETVIRVLHARMADPNGPVEKHKLECELIPRDSTAPPHR
jgi:DNA-binding LacI/PurR family transcriptional regulator